MPRFVSGLLSRCLSSLRLAASLRCFASPFGSAASFRRLASSLRFPWLFRFAASACRASPCRASPRFASLRFAFLRLASRRLRFASLRVASVRFASLLFASLRFASVRFASLRFALTALLVFLPRSLVLPSGCPCRLGPWRQLHDECVERSLGERASGFQCTCLAMFSLGSWSCACRVPP